MPQLVALNGSVKHSGDEQDGSKEGYDEIIQIDLPRIPPNIHILAFVVNAYQGGTLADVETARATILQEGSGELCSLSLCCGTAVAATATVCFLMFRRGAQWCVRNVETTARGRTFAESYPAVLTALQAVVDPALIMERRANMDKVPPALLPPPFFPPLIFSPPIPPSLPPFLPPNRQTFKMNKDDVMEIPEDLFMDGNSKP